MVGNVILPSLDMMRGAIFKEGCGGDGKSQPTE